MDLDYEYFDDGYLEISHLNLDRTIIMGVIITYTIFFLLIMLFLVYFFSLFLVGFLSSLTCLHMYIKGEDNQKITDNLFFDYLFTLIILISYIFIIDFLFKQGIYPIL